MRAIVFLLPVFFGVTSACVTTQESATSAVSQGRQLWKDHSASQVFSDERNQFIGRLGATYLCWPKSINDFTRKHMEHTEGCLYPAYSRSEPARHRYMALQVVQTRPEGFLVDTQDGDRLVFIHKTDEAGVVDGNYLDNTTEPLLYEYSGQFTYPTVLGAPNTVHSFKKISAESIRRAQDGLKVYKFINEVLAGTGVWSELGYNLQLGH